MSITFIIFETEKIPYRHFSPKNRRNKKNTLKFTSIFLLRKKLLFPIGNKLNSPQDSASI